MKGLFVKDFEIVLMQWKLLALFVIIAIFSALMTYDSSFIAGYLMIFSVMFALGTVSYDEFNNGYPFLFTLPITRKEYVLEKYAFTLLCGVTAWGMALLFIVAIHGIRRENIMSAEELAGSASLLLVAVIMLCVTLPARLKFGSEKSKLVLYVICGLMVGSGFLLQNIDAVNSELLTSVLEMLSTWNTTYILLAMGVLCIVFILISMGISMHIMAKKQF